MKPGGNDDGQNPLGTLQLAVSSGVPLAECSDSLMVLDALVATPAFCCRNIMTAPATSQPLVGPATTGHPQFSCLASQTVQERPEY